MSAFRCIILRRERSYEPTVVTGATVHFRDGTQSRVDCCEDRADVLTWLPEMIAEGDEG